MHPFGRSEVFPRLRKAILVLAVIGAALAEEDRFHVGRRSCPGSEAAVMSLL